MESNKKMVTITHNFKIYFDYFQTPKHSYTHPFELNFVANMFSSFQSFCIDKYKTYHLIICHITDSEDTLLYGFTPNNKKDYWPLIFAEIAYNNEGQVIYDTLVDVHTLEIKKKDAKFILDELKDVFRQTLRYEHRKHLDKEDVYSEDEQSFEDETVEENVQQEEKDNNYEEEEGADPKHDTTHMEDTAGHDNYDMT
ncbi:hypothetical protein HEP_00524900, partial [Hepatocystis sp. ex Piliocolobus tephrosceles]